MKKLIFIGLLLVPLSIHASVISSKSPWGCNPVWLWDSNPVGSAEMAYYDSVLDSTVSCGMSWIRPAGAPGDNFNKGAMDDFMIVVNKHPVNLVWITDPAGTDIAGWTNFWDSVVTRYGTNGNMPGLTRPVKYNQEREIT